MKYIKCYPDFKMKAVTFSFDDGTYHDIEMIEVMNKFNLKGTFNLNSLLTFERENYSTYYFYSLEDFQCDEEEY